MILEASALDERHEEKVLARFKADRDQQYRAFIQRCDGFEAEVARERERQAFTFADLEEEDADLKRLEIRLDRIRRHDFYDGTLVREATIRFEGCQRLLDLFAEDVVQHAQRTTDGDG